MEKLVDVRCDLQFKTPGVPVATLFLSFPLPWKPFRAVSHYVGGRTTAVHALQSAFGPERSEGLWEGEALSAPVLLALAVCQCV